MASRGSYYTEDQFSEFDFDIHVRINDPIVTVYLEDVNSGIRAKASAKRNDPDRFSVETGTRIALARALGRFARRVEKKAIRELDLVAS